MIKLFSVIALSMLIGITPKNEVLNSSNTKGYGQYFVSNGSVLSGMEGNYARYWYFIIPMTTMNTLNYSNNAILTDDIPNTLRYHLLGGFLGYAGATNVLSLTSNDDTPIYNTNIDMVNSMYYGNRNLFTELVYTPVDLINRDYDLYQINHNDNGIHNYYHLLFELQGSWSGNITSTYLSTEEAIIKGVFGGGITEPSLYEGSIATYWYEYGYDDGYNVGLDDGYDIGLTEGSSQTFTGNLHTWIVPAIITVLFVGGGLAMWNKRKQLGE